MKMTRSLVWFWLCLVMLLCALSTGLAQGGWTTPVLPDGKMVATGTGPELIALPAVLKVSPAEGGYEIAKTPPIIDFLFYPGQTYKAPVWSAWGNGCAFNGKYYSAIGDHGWRAMVYEYDPKTKQVRTILDITEFLKLPDGHYTPGKVHCYITPGKDGWLYFATHNSGLDKATAKYHFTGDWLLRHDPKSGKTEIITRGPGGAFSYPTGFSDPDRMIFYAGTEQELRFLAYDMQARKTLALGPAGEGASRNMLFSRTTGRVYYRAHDGKCPMRRYDPATNTSTVIDCPIDPRSSSDETPQGFIYAIDWDGMLWKFNVKTEAAEKLGFAPVAKFTYTTSLAVDPTGRYLYYSCGAHGGAKDEGTPIVQFDTVTKKKKVIAFLTPYTVDKYGYVCDGTYSMVISEDGSTLFTTWNGLRKGSREWDACAMTAIYIPESERPLK